jgi:hypothetical protein
MLLFFVLLLTLVCACKDSGEQPTANDLIGITGTVIAKSSTFYVIQCDVPIHYSERTIYPINLSDPFRQDHLRVRFSGRVEADPLTYYAYLPVRLTFIQSLLSDELRSNLNPIFVG